MSKNAIASSSVIGKFYLKRCNLLRTALLTLIILTYLIACLTYAHYTPMWQAPDEPAHYNTIRHIAQTGILPVLTAACYNQAYLDQLRGEKFPPHLSIASVCYEHYQPPLYYLLASPIFIATEGSVLVLRLFSALLGATSLVMVYKTIGLFMPQTTIRLGTVAFVAFVPMHVSMLSSINNDSLAELLLISLIYVLLGWLLHPPKKIAQTPMPWLAGILLGLMLITKVTIYISLPLSFLVLILNSLQAKAVEEHRELGGHPPSPPAWRHFFRGHKQFDWTDIIKNGLRLYVPALLISLPMYLRNAWVYGGLDVLGLARHDAVVVGQLRTTDYITQIGWLNYGSNLFKTVFNSFWGQFGWMAVPMDNRVYLVLGLLTILAGTGLSVWLRQVRALPKDIKLALTVMGATIILVMGIFIGLNFSFVQFQGRYFFTALMPLGLFFTLGWQTALTRRWAWVMLGVLVLASAVAGFNAYRAQTLSKWTVLITGGLTGGLFIRRWIPLESGDIFVAFIYTGLAGLTLSGVWWFIIPNL